ncbi:MAG: hypothetical protein NT025_06260 [bacterium]|nr:hypothetical protein [bacterium]
MLKRLIAVLLIGLALFIWGCPKDEDDETPPQHSITVTAPNGGQTWQVGSNHAITWTSSEISTVTIEWSVDGGTNWTEVVASLANNNTYSWTLPNTPTITGKVKVRDASDAAVFDVSDANFTVIAESASDNASGSVTSDTSGVIETALGARISVPAGAVPRTDQGNIGTIVFSIERNNDIAVTPPSGETLASDIYQFGPEGFTFARPVEVSIPVPGESDPGDVSLWRKNHTTGVAEFFSSSYDPVSRKVSAQTYVLSPWFITTNNRVDDASACIHVSNNSLDSWLFVCVDQYTLDFPAQTDWLPEDGQGVLYAPIGTIGWAQEGNWYVPQGVYRLCLQRESETTPGQYYHVFLDDVQATYPWHHDSQMCADVSYGDFMGADTGRCGCIPTPTTSVGTGDIQVTLTWFIAPPGVDLDLWVMDPDSEWCYYGNGQAPDTTTSGLQLDRDNLCWSYENGRPENIYSTRAPLAGQYVVAVNWYSTCDTAAVGSLPFNVRTVIGSHSQTFSQTIEENEDMHEVTRFTISGSSVVFQPPRSDVSWVHLPRARKL